MSNKLCMYRVSARWIPPLLLPDQMWKRVKGCREYYLTCDETWMHLFEPENKQHNSIWEHPSSPSPTKALISKFAGKVMTIIFCVIQSIILNHFVPPNTTVTGNYYVTIIKSNMFSVIKQKHPQLVKSGILLHHDASNNSIRVVSDTFKELDIEMLPHPPYSPDLAIFDVWLFPTIRNRQRMRCWPRGVEVHRRQKSARDVT